MMKRLALGMLVTMGLAGLFPDGARAAGTNLALMVATNQLTLPTNGTVAVIVTSAPVGVATNFNLFQYNTVSNYNVARWTVTLPPRRIDGMVLNDTDAKLIFLQYRFPLGTVFGVQ